MRESAEISPFCQELTLPTSKIGADCGFSEWTDSWCALRLGGKTSAKVEGGTEIIELKPLKMQELTDPVHDYSKICADCGFSEWTDTCRALMLGCKTPGKVDGGAATIALKPLKMLELTHPAHYHSKNCADSGFS